MQKAANTSLYLEALCQAGVIDHALEISLEDDGAEIALLESIQGIAAGPVFRIARGHYAFLLPQEQIEPLTEALADADGTLRAVVADRTADPHLDDMGIALLSAVRDAAEEASAPVVAQAVVSAAFAVEAARITADGLAGSGEGRGVPLPDFETLEEQLKAIRAALEAPERAGPATGEGGLVDLASQTEAAFAWLSEDGIARREDVAALDARIAALTSEIKADEPPGQKLYALLRQRMEALQARSDQIAAHLGGVSGSGSAERDEIRQDIQTGLENVRTRLARLLAERQEGVGTQEQPEMMGPFLPSDMSTGKAGDGLDGLVQELDEVAALFAKLGTQDRAGQGEPFREVLEATLQDLHGKLDILAERDAGEGGSGALSESVDRLVEVAAKVEALAASEAVSGAEEMADQFNALTTRLGADKVALAEEISGAVAQASERQIAGLDDLQSGLDLRLQTLISRDGGLADQLEDVAEKVGQLQVRGEAGRAQDTAQILEMMGKVSADLGDLRSVLKALPQNARQGVASDIKAVEARLEAALGALSGQSECLLEHAARFAEGQETGVNVLAELGPSLEGLVAEGRDARADISDLAAAFGAHDKAVSAALPNLEDGLERLSRRVEGLDTSLSQTAKAADLAALTGKLEVHAADTEPRLLALAGDIGAIAEASAQQASHLEARAAGFEARLEAAQVGLSRLQDKVAQLLELPAEMDRRFGRIESVLTQMSRHIGGEARDTAAVTTALSEILRRMDRGTVGRADECDAASNLRDDRALPTVQSARLTPPDQSHSDAVGPANGAASQAELQHDLRLMLAEFLAQTRRSEDGVPPAAAG